MKSFIKKAEILIEALPYIQKLNGKTVVIKYGGHAMINEQLKEMLMQDITLLKYIGINPIVVHGGGPDITSALEAFNIKSEFISGLRVTDRRTMEIAQMALMGKTNKEIVSILNNKGGKAVGLCGIDGNLIECRKYMPEVDGKNVDIGYVGEIVNINSSMLELITKDQYIPVIAPIGVGENGESYNINADTAASAIACAVNAEKLFFLTDVEGIKTSDKKTIYSINIAGLNEMIANNTISGGMIPKAQGCIEAIETGVNNVHIIDGRIPHCILLEIFTDTGIGTMITK